MPFEKGKIVLMGSGELTSTMVEVHKEVLKPLDPTCPAVFLDTPAGFQLNADQISARAVDYFSKHIDHPLTIASFKSRKTTSPVEAERAFGALRGAGYVLVGPGSPTYAVRQLVETPVPEILARRIESGACLVAASAAALTLGRFTLPVYELYKVGEDPHWVEGLNILGRFDLNLVVIPHWNNAEGGNHDTRCCFMGESRFRELALLLPDDAAVLGLDEHTACIIDLGKKEVSVRGIGKVVLRRHGSDLTFEKGACFPLDVFYTEDFDLESEPARPALRQTEPAPTKADHSFWEEVHRLRSLFHHGLETRDPGTLANALLELDATVWQAQNRLENEDAVSQAREILRDLIALLAMTLETAPVDEETVIGPLVEEILALRGKFRKNRQWEAADAVRDCLQRVHVYIEDARDGARWRFNRGQA